MRKTYHISFSSHDEVLYRTEADMIMGFNCLAETVLYTESRLLAEGFLSTHWHSIVQTDDPVYFARRQRYAYTRHFNALYGRSGRLGETQAFITEIDGIARLMTALNYVNRQGLHHGLATTPFAYPHCSANVYFRKELGKDFFATIRQMPDEQRHRYLTRNVKIPGRYRMDENGLLLREDIIDAAYVEQIYITPRNFLFQMNKCTDGRTEEDQKQEKSDTPIITIDLIEQGTPDFDRKRLLLNEQGRVNKSMMTDLELCHLIDDFYIPQMKGKERTATLYALAPSERTALFEAIRRDCQRSRFAESEDKRTLIGKAGLSGKTATETQLRRCLAL